MYTQRQCTTPEDKLKRLLSLHDSYLKPGSRREREYRKLKAEVVTALAATQPSPLAPRTEEEAREELRAATDAYFYAEGDAQSFAAWQRMNTALAEYTAGQEAQL